MHKMISDCTKLLISTIKFDENHLYIKSAAKVTKEVGAGKCAP